jgi:hypothetical protein
MENFHPDGLSHQPSKDYNRREESYTKVIEGKERGGWCGVCPGGGDKKSPEEVRNKSRKEVKEKGRKEK